MTFEKAVSNLRVRQLAAEEENEALAELLKVSIRMRRALRFYADPKNWLDGVVMLEGMAHEDNGFTAQEALQLLDFVGAPIIKEPFAEEGKNAA